MQYGIRLSVEDIGFAEFCRLLRGIMPDTPLGRVVAVRGEKDLGRLRNLGAGEKKIRRDWVRFLSAQAGKDGERDWEKDIEALQGALLRIFG